MDIQTIYESGLFKFKKNPAHFFIIKDSNRC